MIPLFLPWNREQRASLSNSPLRPWELSDEAGAGSVSPPVPQTLLPPGELVLRVQRVPERWLGWGGRAAQLEPGWKRESPGKQGLRFQGCPGGAPGLVLAAGAVPPTSGWGQGEELL